MKMTVEFDDGLAREAEACAAERGETLGDLIGRVLADYVKGAREAPRSLDLLTRGGRPVPGVDIDNRAALYDLMDARD
ncbi:MAG: DUF2191 domain-containing protein [Rhodospirillaceae bacterium]|nr:DUF2191 domain-containing protein [Rhodospirillaceae bacterium]